MGQNNQDERYDYTDFSDGDPNLYPLVVDNPLDRKTAFGVNCHGDWEDRHTEVISTLAEIRDVYDDHVLAVGGDKGGRGGPTTHYLIKYEDMGACGEYTLTQYKQVGGRETFEEAGDVYERLAEIFDGGYVYVALLHERESEFMFEGKDSTGPVVIAA